MCVCVCGMLFDVERRISKDRIIHSKEYVNNAAATDVIHGLQIINKIPQSQFVAIPASKDNVFPYDPLPYHLFK